MSPVAAPSACPASRAGLIADGCTPVLLVAGIVLAALTDAVAGTVLSAARLDMMGVIHTTPDEFARLDVGYTGAKLAAFLVTPWLMGRCSPSTCLRGATAVMTLACGAAALASDSHALIALRVLQGIAGGALLVSGQTLLFQTFPRSRQPMIQCLFAIGTVVAPATLMPCGEGWLLDSRSWRWIFLSTVPIGVAALALLAFARMAADADPRPRRLDGAGLVLFASAAFCLAYVLDRGSRWNWSEEPMIPWLALAGTTALLLFIAHQLRSAGRDTLLDLSIFGNGGFLFGFIVSFPAGFALFGSAYLVSSFAVAVLRMTSTAAGMLLLPSALTFVASLFLTAIAVRRYALSPVVTVPFGVVGLMVAMWMLSGATGESGFPDLMPAILLRGLALGFLFLSLTLITLLDLGRSQIPYGIGLFNIGRQAGGLLGVAFLETLLDHQTALNRAVLAAHVVEGRVELAERLAKVAATLGTRGLESDQTARSAVHVVLTEVTAQANIIAYDTAFLTVALFFVAAAPILVATKILIGRRLAGPRP